MPIFGSRRHDSPVREPSPPLPPQNDAPSRHRSIFSRRRSPSPDMRSPTDNHSNRRGSMDDGYNSNNQKRGGFFSRRRSASSDRTDSSGGYRDRDGYDQRNGSGSGNGNARNGTLNHGKWNKDPAIGAARDKVSGAEEAERMADRALVQARAAVREARQHVRNLEREAEEEAKRAKAKQQEARSVSNSARGLGRHGP